MIRHAQETIVIGRRLVVDLDTIVRGFEDPSLRVFQAHGPSVEHENLVMRLCPPTMIGA
jgi:hypothetical protein